MACCLGATAARAQVVLDSTGRVSFKVLPETVTVGQPFVVSMRAIPPSGRKAVAPAVPDTGGLVEPLDPAFTAAHFAKNIRSSSRAIKTVLMDQRRVAGIGNIYANEALWRAKIRPSRRASTLTLAESARLFEESRAVLSAAVDKGGTSFRDYRDPNGERGRFLSLAKVYSHQGEPCARCGTTLRSSHAIENRITVWCTSCQK